MCVHDSWTYIYWVAVDDILAIELAGEQLGYIERINWVQPILSGIHELLSGHVC